MSAHSSDDARIREIYSDIQILRETVVHAGVTREMFVHPTDRTQAAIADGITYQLYRILEEATNLTDRTKGEFREAHWDEMRGMRNRLVHNYPGTDFDTVWDVVESGLEELETVCLDYSEITGISLDDGGDSPDIGPR